MIQYQEPSTMEISTMEMSTMGIQKYTASLELLAPAGSAAAARAVIHAGADAIYLGGEYFGARASADNFTSSRLLEMIDYAHLYGRKVYLTVNTLLKQQEMDMLYDYLLPFYEQGLDAVIVQDFGVMCNIRRCFPDLPIHISTQMSVADVCGAAYLKHLGASRVVLARELSLDEIRSIHNEVDIEIECFVHGALCYCYSGQCLFSSMLGGRSGNRGRCAQPCRLPYTVLDEHRHRISETDCYPLSPRDLCTLGQLEELVRAGITSFKIEGRMKSPEYAAGVTAIYRKYLDACGEVPFRQPEGKDMRYLLETGNRSGFTSGYYHQHNGPDMITLKGSAYVKGDAPYLDKVRKTYVQQETKIPVQGNIRLRTGQPAEFTVSARGVTVSVRDDPVSAAVSQPVSREMVIQQLSRTGNTCYTMESVEITMDEHIFLPKQILNRLRRNALDGLTKEFSEPHRRKAPPQPFGSFSGEKASGKMERVSDEPPYFTAVVEEKSQLAAVLEYDYISRIYLDCSMYGDNLTGELTRHITKIHAAGRLAYFVFPAVFRRKTACFYETHWQQLEQTGIDGYLAADMDVLGFLDQRLADKSRCVLGHGLYAWSDETKDCYRERGWLYDTIPLELNRKELTARDNRTGELVIYGYTPLMISAQCILRTLGSCKGTKRLCYLKDRYAKEFPVKNNCRECYNIIYNSQPLSLIRLSGEAAAICPGAYRLHFTIESGAQVRAILDGCRQAFFEKRTPDMDAVTGICTKGHFKRGVE